MLFTSFFFCIKTPNFYLKMIRMFCLHVLGFLCFFLCNWVLICSVVFCIFLISSSFTEKSRVCLIFTCSRWYWRLSVSCFCSYKDWSSCSLYFFWSLDTFWWCCISSSRLPFITFSWSTSDLSFTIVCRV